MKLTDLSPSHLDTRSELETEKNVELLASVATALARKDLPVPEMMLINCLFVRKTPNDSQTWRPEQQNSAPWLPLSSEKMGELDRKNNRLLQSFFGALEACDIVPLNVRFLHHDGVIKFALHLLFLWVIIII